MKCKKRSNKIAQEGGKYDKVAKVIESEDSDGTESEIDSDDDYIEKLIE